jgi:ketopantoate reductase
MPDAGPSMRPDHLARRRSEIDVINVINVINGQVVELSREMDGVVPDTRRRAPCCEPPVSA